MTEPFSILLKKNLLPRVVARVGCTVEGLRATDNRIQAKRS